MLASPESEDGPALFGALAAVVALLSAVVWAATGAGTFWPVWTWLGLGTAVALFTLIQRTRAQPLGPLRVHAALAAIAVSCSFGVWLASGAGTFWPGWVAFGWGASWAVHAVLRARDQLPGARRERRLVARVDDLERTRRGALDVQAAELRRIERDLHDGAQARLVALTMRLGRAESRLEEHPEAAALVREARADASAAIAELRDLARGIAPPVLADRGLVAAVQALGERAPVTVTLTAAVPARLPPVVEGAAYFVVSEALTNVAKHAPPRRRHRDADGRAVVATHRRRRRRPGRRGRDRLGPGRAAPARRRAGRDARARVPGRRRHAPGGGASVRVVIAEDQALLREGLVALLTEHDVDVVGQAGDAAGLLRIVAGHRPDVAIVDVRMPPTHTDEGLRAALELRTRHPELGVLVLSAYVEPVYTAELLRSPGTGGLGYLLKERVGDARAFVEAVERVAAGGTALDREVVARLMGESRADSPALDTLTPREREVLELIAQGRTNAAIARALVVTPGAVEKHVTSIFGKLGLTAGKDDHRRVLAVLAFLQTA